MDDLRAELLRLELAIAQRRLADLPGGYASVIHEAFHETGASGRWWTREETLGELERTPAAGDSIKRFEIDRLAEGVVLATFDSGGERPARRVSIWVRDEGRWRLRFHQGTLL
jgi:ribonuclease HI